MSTTTAKRGPGRPATKKAPAQKVVAKDQKLSIKREVKTNKILEYRTKSNRGAVFVMQQRGTTIFDKEAGNIREIRYCPNEPSIFRDEQSEMAKREPIIFRDGVIFVRPEQPNLAAFLEAHPDNVANGGKKFYRVDSEKKAKVDINEDFLIADAIAMVRDKDLDSLLSIAMVRNINIDRPVAEIKHDLLIYAKKNPKAFIESFDDPIIEMKAKMRTAQKYQVISLSSKSVNWFDTGKLILSIPEGKDPMDVFVRYCMTEAAVPLVEEIEKQIRG